MANTALFAPAGADSGVFSGGNLLPGTLIGVKFQDVFPRGWRVVVQFIHRSSVDEMVDDLPRICGGHRGQPTGTGFDDHVRTVAALREAA